ncbi:methyltransferase domain-containing protein [Sphingomonas sp.]|uniref:class I SAM-dependent methyltransferase n=1 Tax=Sphingomonas sp. TaxID=28214 RepID=UPI003CC5ECBD
MRQGDVTTAIEWSGPVGDVWAAEWRRTDRSFAGLTPHLDAAILAAAPATGGRAVDLGCGAGQTSIALAAALPGLAVTGVDISAELVRLAAGRAVAMPNLRFTAADLNSDVAVADGADLLCSRHGVMFFADPRTVLTRLHAVVVPGARLVFSCFRVVSENAWAGTLVERLTGQSLPALDGYVPGPFGFGDEEMVAAMLKNAGWAAPPPVPIDFDYVAGEGADPVGDAAAFFRRIGPVAAALRAAPDDQRVAMGDRLLTVLTEHRCGDRVVFPAAAWIWTAQA